jgi:hypothetical protein
MLAIGGLDQAADDSRTGSIVDNFNRLSKASTHPVQRVLGCDLLIEGETRVKRRKWWRSFKRRPLPTRRAERRP